MDEMNLIPVQIEKATFSVLISGMYCGFHKIDPMAIPESVWLEIVEKLEYFLPTWDFSKITLEQFVMNNLMIYPTQMLDEDTIKDMQENTLYWKRVNGNVMLSISMDIRAINGG